MNAYISRCFELEYLSIFEGNFSHQSIFELKSAEKLYKSNIIQRDYRARLPPIDIDFVKTLLKSISLDLKHVLRRSKLSIHELITLKSKADLPLEELIETISKVTFEIFKVEISLISVGIREISIKSNKLLIRVVHGDRNSSLPVEYISNQGKSYVLIMINFDPTKDYFSIQNMVSLAHEVGHALNFHYENLTKNRIVLTSDIEIEDRETIPMMFEWIAISLFQNSLIEQDMLNLSLSYLKCELLHECLELATSMQSECNCDYSKARAYGRVRSLNFIKLADII
ncbi:hypothetical protein F9L16_22925 [Agarivorans sp. B2Z047]|uniref:hypothetical protein n=1 Tax=Agarivorans sp. B2Z047 TaxID=2652721 RepID=UPI00128CF286|nr:hypothetical protein [Agarivorans sp. B2Z047]MPW31826.1 hypothetical protein [Agarivorans sp. B2Z047]UQN41936.1 hypothetical protein LQZ07_19485 [Agarivorans sp. B2Z047]